MGTEPSGKASGSRLAKGPFYAIVPLIQAASGLCLLLAAAAFPFLVDLPLGAAGLLGGVLSMLGLVIVALSGLMGVVLGYSAYCLAAKRERALELAHRAQNGHVVLHLVGLSPALAAGSTAIVSVLASMALAAGVLWWIHRRKARAEDHGLPVDAHKPPLAAASP